MPYHLCCCLICCQHLAGCPALTPFLPSLSTHLILSGVNMSGVNLPRINPSAGSGMWLLLLELLLLLEYARPQQ